MPAGWSLKGWRSAPWCAAGFGALLMPLAVAAPFHVSVGPLPAGEALPAQQATVRFVSGDGTVHGAGHAFDSAATLDLGVSTPIEAPPSAFADATYDAASDQVEATLRALRHETVAADVVATDGMRLSTPDAPLTALISAADTLPIVDTTSFESSGPAPAALATDGARAARAAPALDAPPARSNWSAPIIVLSALGAVAYLAATNLRRSLKVNTHRKRRRSRRRMAA